MGRLTDGGGAESRARGTGPSFLPDLILLGGTRAAFIGVDLIVKSERYIDWIEFTYRQERMHSHAFLRTLQVVTSQVFEQRLTSSGPVHPMMHWDRSPNFLRPLKISFSDIESWIQLQLDKVFRLAEM